MRILVQPEQLRQNARILRQGSEFWRAQAARLRSLLAGLDWEIRQKANVDAQVQEAVRLAELLAARNEASAAFLEAAAARFEQAEAEGVQALATVLSASVMKAVFVPLAARLPGAAGSLWRLGTLFSGRVLPSTRLLPIGSQPAIPKGTLARIVRSGMKKAQQKSAPRSGRVVQRIEVAAPKGQAGAPGIPLPLSVEEAREKLKADPNMAHMWRQIEAPIQSAPGQRSPELYRAVIDQFDVEHSHPGRYRPSQQYPDTRCNIFAGDVMRAMGAPLPTKGELHGRNDPMTANARDIYDALRNGWGGWRRIDVRDPDGLQRLLEHLRQGKPAVASDPGHIAVLRPDQPAQIRSPADLRIAQAGARNANDISLGEAGYGRVFKPEFFIHE
jgi:hypothetical protein